MKYALIIILILFSIVSFSCLLIYFRCDELNMQNKQLTLQDSIIKEKLKKANSDTSHKWCIKLK